MGLPKSPRHGSCTSDMNRTLVLHVLPQSTALDHNQAIVLSYDESSMGLVNLVVEAVDTDERVPDGCAVFGFANELGVITQTAPIADVASVFGFSGSDITRELRDMARDLVAALS